MAFVWFKVFQISQVLSVGLTMGTILFLIEQQIKWWYKQPGCDYGVRLTTVCLLMCYKLPKWLLGLKGM